MFSGIVEEYAEVVRIVKEQENLHLTLKCSFVDELKIDQSISHNGVWLPDCIYLKGGSDHGYRHERNDRAFQHRLAESGR